MEKISKSYFCDYCGERCAHTEFILPEKGEDNVEWAKDRLTSKISLSGTLLRAFHLC